MVADGEELRRTVEALKARGLTLCCAESLTGGALASRIVNVPGVSAVFRGAVVSYATDVKASVLGVSQNQLDETGPVDETVARQMARGACRVLAADVGVATTGVAGPGPADGHPAGTVWIAISGALGERAELLALDGSRTEIREGAVQCALGLVARALDDVVTNTKSNLLQE